MHTWIALFRGINVGGNNLIPMKTLVDLMTKAGCIDVQSYIQSGNVLFKHQDINKAELATLLSNLVFQHFGFSPKVLLLDAAEFSVLLANNPFKQAYEQPKNLHVFFLDDSAKSPDIEKINSLKAATEEYHLQAGGFYLYAPDGIGRSTLAAKVEKCLGVATTARNLNTLIKISEMLAKAA
jgi:uncharacterized protein (DUF1697 family)